MENLETTKRTAMEIEEKVSKLPRSRCCRATGSGRALPATPGTRCSAGAWVPRRWITPTCVHTKVKEAKVTEVQINVARENYRPAAERASLLYFILSDLNKINPIYQFSLKVDEEQGGDGFVRAGQGSGGVSGIWCLCIYAANSQQPRR